MIDKQAQMPARQTLMALLRSDKSARVSFDVDETFAGTFSVMIRLYNSVKGTGYTLTNHTDWDFKGIGSTYKEMMHFYVEAWQKHWTEIPMIVDRKNVMEVVQYVASDISTSRGGDGLTDGTSEHVAQWVLANRLAFMPWFCDKTTIPKADLGYEIYVDDSPRLAEKVAKSGDGLVLLVEKPYNRYIAENEQILKVANADDAIGEIIDACQHLGIEKRHYQDLHGQEFLLSGDGKIPRWITGSVFLEALKERDYKAVRQRGFSFEKLWVLRVISDLNSASIGQIRANVRLDSIGDMDVDWRIKDLTAMDYITNDNGRYRICDTIMASLIRNDDLVPSYMRIRQS